MGIVLSGILWHRIEARRAIKEDVLNLTVVPRYRRHNKIIYNSNLGSPPYSGRLLGLVPKQLCRVGAKWGLNFQEFYSG